MMDGEMLEEFSTLLWEQEQGERLQALIKEEEETGRKVA
jgi:hypothetical protein